MLDQAAARPRVRALQGLHLVGARVQQGGELVEGEHDVGAQLVLDAHRHLRREAVLRAVDVGGEDHAVVIDHCIRGLDGLRGQPRVVGVGRPRELLGEDFLEARTQGEHLESARIRVRRAPPVHEARETARLVDHVGAGPQVQVVSVGQDRLGAQGLDHLRGQGLHIRLRAHRDERGRADRAVRRVDGACAPQAAARGQARPHLETPVAPPRRRGGGKREGNGGSGQPIGTHAGNTSEPSSPSRPRTHPITRYVSGRSTTSTATLYT